MSSPRPYWLGCEYEVTSLINLLTVEGLDVVAGSLGVSVFNMCGKRVNVYWRYRNLSDLLTNSVVIYQKCGQLRGAIHPFDDFKLMNNLER